jgi:hypothetical protein
MRILALTPPAGLSLLVGCRCGLASRELTYTSYELFENLVNYRR